MSSDPFQEARRKAREEYARETAGEATDRERSWRDAQPGESERDRAYRVGAREFDESYYASFGRYPEESPLYGTTPKPDDSRRREAIQALIDRGATEGEREAARAAMYRLDHPSTVAHDATERGSYYARDTLGGNDDG